MVRNARSRFAGTTKLVFGAVLLTSFALATTRVHADAQEELSNAVSAYGGIDVVNFINSGNVVVDPNTSIPFPKTIHIPSKIPVPDLTLIGVGVRTVSFLGIKVYSVAFYADLNNPVLQVGTCFFVPICPTLTHEQIPQSATPEAKIDHIIKNTTCALRVIPTRGTSYSHLRDGFMRALQGRLVLAKKAGTLTPQEEREVQPPLRKFKSMFPNSKPLEKHQPLDLLFLAPMNGEPRNLIVRDLGSVQSDWLAQELLRAYFHEKGISPAVSPNMAPAFSAPDALAPR